MPDLGLSAGTFFGGLFGDSNKPYEAAMQPIMQGLTQGRQIQNPFYTAGTNAIPAYNNWLQTMQNPADFIKQIMSSYTASPYAQNQQQEAIRAAQNFGSASGLLDSSPLTQQVQQNASRITSEDMNNWLQHVLGINLLTGQGYGNLINTGQNSANALTHLIGDTSQSLAGLEYGKEDAKQKDLSNTIGGGFSLLGKITGLDNLFK